MHDNCFILRANLYIMWSPWDKGPSLLIIMMGAWRGAIMWPYCPFFSSLVIVIFF